MTGRGDHVEDVHVVTMRGDEGEEIRHLMTGDGSADEPYTIYCIGGCGPLCPLCGGR